LLRPEPEVHGHLIASVKKLVEEVLGPIARLRHNLHCVPIALTDGAIFHIGERKERGLLI
jgi:hypothetical protein